MATCLGCNLDLTNEEERVYTYFRDEIHYDDCRCKKCFISLIGETITVKLADLERMINQFENRKFDCKGCLIQVKNKYKDPDRPNFCTYCTGRQYRGRRSEVQESLVDQFDTNTENWPRFHLDGIDRTPADPARESQIPRKIPDPIEIEDGVAVPMEIFNKIISDMEKAELQKTQAKNRAISKQTWRKR